MLKRIWSITLPVSDLKRAIDFYEKTLGLNKKYEYGSYAGFDCGGIEIGLRPTKKSNEKGGKENVPSLDFFVEDVDATYEALKEKGVEFTRGPHEEPWGAREASFLDPDKNILTIVQIHWQKYFEIAAKGYPKQ